MIAGDGASTVAELVLLALCAEVLFVSAELTLTVGCAVSLEFTLFAETGDPSFVADKDPVM